LIISKTITLRYIHSAFPLTRLENPGVFLEY